MSVLALLNPKFPVLREFIVVYDVRLKMAYFPLYSLFPLVATQQACLQSIIISMANVRLRSNCQFHQQIHLQLRLSMQCPRSRVLFPLRSICKKKVSFRQLFREKQKQPCGSFPERYITNLFKSGVNFCLFSIMFTSRYSLLRSYRKPHSVTLQSEWLLDIVYSELHNKKKTDMRVK